MTILMNVIAYILILALVLLIASMVMLVLTAMGYIALGKKAFGMIEPPKNTAIEIYNTGRGHALVGAGRVRSIISHGRAAAVSVKGAGQSIKVAFRETASEAARARNEAESIKGSVISPAQRGFGLVQQFMDTVQQLRR